MACQHVLLACLSGDTCASHFGHNYVYRFLCDLSDYVCRLRMNISVIRCAGFVFYEVRFMGLM